MKVTPAGGESGRRAMRIGCRIPCCASLPAALTTRGSEPSGKTIFFLERRALSISPARNAVADSGTGIGSSYLNPLDAAGEQKQNGGAGGRQQARHGEHRNIRKAIHYYSRRQVQYQTRGTVPNPGEAGDAPDGVVREEVRED